MKGWVKAEEFSVSASALNAFSCKFYVVFRWSINNHTKFLTISLQQGFLFNKMHLILQFHGGTDRTKLEGLLQDLKDEHRAKKGAELDTDEWRLLGCTRDTPRQLNGTLMAGHYVCYRNWSPSHIDHSSRKFLHTLIFFQWRLWLWRIHMHVLWLYLQGLPPHLWPE